jgi:fimbrial chaperone protein
MKLKNNRRTLSWALLGVVAITMATPAAALFDASVSPPRFELKAKPGDVVRSVITIANNGVQPERYSIKTADWDLDSGGSVKYDEGAPGPKSCRPWVRIERHEINVVPKGTRSYRFEVHVPNDVAMAECRFALLVAGNAGTVSPTTRDKRIQIPIVGRLGVIVYVTLNDGRADIQLLKLEMRKVDGRMVPIATFHNKGNVHGRVQGSLEARDARNHKLQLIADQAPILPNTTRSIILSPTDWSSGEPKAPAFDLAMPLEVHGRLQYADGEVKIDQFIR